MKINTNSILIVFGIFAFAFMACIPLTWMALPLLQPEQQDPYDAFATIQAIVTQTANAPTQILPTVVPATATLVPPTSTSAPVINTAIPTAASYCDWVEFVKDVTIPDGTQLVTGEAFTKVWRLQNRGTCAWTADYMLVFTSGDPMGSTTAVRLPGYVAPGQTVDVSISLTAPASTGTYRGYWMLRNTSGVIFGDGSRANEAFYVEIRTTAPAIYGVVTGNLSYPSEFIPAMRVAAFSLTNGKAYFLDTARGQAVYSISLPPGTYYVVSYPYEGIPGYTGRVDSYTLGGGSFAGGYTKAVQCGLTVECIDNQLVSVVVQAGGRVVVSPADWYAPEGSFPKMPAP
jgi:hypothetical protein